MSSLALYVAFSWSETLARNTSVVLYALRFIGVLLFEIFNLRVMLLFFPNLFEFFFLFYAYMQVFHHDFLIQNYKRLALILILLAIPKLVQEYILHVLEARPWVHFKYDVLKWPRA